MASAMTSRMMPLEMPSAPGEKCSSLVSSPPRISRTAATVAAVVSILRSTRRLVASGMSAVASRNGTSAILGPIPIRRMPLCTAYGTVAGDRLPVVCAGGLGGSPADGGGLGLGLFAEDADRHVVDGEGPFPAQVAGEGEPPAEQRPDAVAPAGEEADVDEQPGDPAGEAAEVQLPGGDDGAPAGDVGGRAQVVIAERLVKGLVYGLQGDLAARVMPRLHGDLGDSRQPVQAHH